MLHSAKIQLRWTLHVCQSLSEMPNPSPYLRGEAKGESDLDILVEFKPDAKISLLEFVELEKLSQRFAWGKGWFAWKICIKTKDWQKYSRWGRILIKKETGDYIEDILETMTNAIEFTRDMSYDEFVKDTLNCICCYQSHRNYWRGSQIYQGKLERKSRYSLEKHNWNERWSYIWVFRC